jgi:hypothetical protein
MKTIRIDFTLTTTFQLIKEKVSAISSTGKQYSSVYNEIKTRNKFKKILWSVPDPGAVVIYGVNNDSLKPIEVKYSSENLRKDFLKSQKKLSNGSQVDRYSWMVGLLSSGTYNELKIFTTNSI